ncbi:MAG: hypothetical protein JRI67_11720 [Deltaproteobacteria bacterium]|nr:hypothetical protein [Deltaproteobacteria bacterium]
MPIEKEEQTEDEHVDIEEGLCQGFGWIITHQRGREGHENHEQQDHDVDPQVETVRPPDGL